MKKVVNAIFLLLVILTSSCSSVVSWLYGYKEPKHLQEVKLQRLGKQLDIAPNVAYKIIEYRDIDSMYRVASRIKSSDTTLIHDLNQPLQVRAYQGNELVFIRINCNVASGFPKLNWNFDGAFDHYPPKSQFKVDSAMSFKNEVESWSKYNSTVVPRVVNDQDDLTIVIFWARMLKKQSKHLIKTIKNYKEEHLEKKIMIYYVNTDNLFVELDG